MRRAQMEVMGLAVIIILVSLAMLFVLQFIVLNQPEGLKKQYTYKELAANFLQTAHATTTDCANLNNPTLEYLIQDCAMNQQDYAFQLNCNGTPSCIYVNDTLAYMLNKTFEKWNIDYELWIRTEFGGYTIQIINLTYGNCTGERIPSTPCCPLPGGIRVRLDLCG